DVLNDPSFAPFINGSTLNSVAQVKVEGNFTINKDFTIESTHFVMDAGAGINVSTGQTLTIDNSILDVCGNTMWNGISVNGTSAEVIVSGSEIWEAVKGIHSLNGGKFTVSNSLFDGNNHGIYVSGYDGAHPGTVRSSVFKSSELLLAPYQGNRAAAGIYLEYISDDPNVSGGITIGSPAQSSDENVFHGPGLPTFPGVLAPGLIYGIVSVQSSANIYNNRFTGFV